ncbi:MAG: septal ring lytic transglycosylase RlpA family protein [Moraxellaceae bacterium]|nr:septal ring lytic transglycosylase RlpA family protein [Moraxellaceae bacterium]
MKKLLLISTLVMSSVAPASANIASWYGGKFHGRLTASGEKFNKFALTAAHRTLKFGSKVRVTNKKTGKSTVVCINDRGPYAHGRSIDLSQAAAKKIGMAGVARVTLKVLSQPKNWRYGMKPCK